jgi:tetraacyldisaccharide 4'-kinase
LNIIFKILLSPFSLLYGLGVGLRNLFFNIGLLPQKKFDLPIISVGNLSVGGTGKTPMVEYLIDIIQEEGLKPAVISQGYKRKKGGYILMEDEHSAREVGDEPYQIKTKFPNTPVVVSKKRVSAIKKLLQQVPDIDVIILDDAFQYRYVKPGVNILLTEYSSPFPEDFLLPAGNLREPKPSKKRADIIIVTKSMKVLSPFEVGRLKEMIKPKAHQELYFSYINYQSFVDFNNPEATYDVKDFSDYKVVLFTGIANPLPLKAFLERRCKEVTVIKFGDHHQYNYKDYTKINERLKEIFINEKAVVTTEKDIKRIQSLDAKEYFKLFPLYYLPLQFEFHESEENQNFTNKIINYVRNNQKNRPINSGKS